MENFLVSDNCEVVMTRNDKTGEVCVSAVIREQKKFDPKNGDFLFEDGRIMIAKSYPSNCHALINTVRDDKVLYDRRYGLNFLTTSFRYATELEKQTLLDALEKDGKYWDAENKCIRDIPSKDFVPKDGDYVTIEYSGDSNFEPDCETNKVVGILRGKLSKGNNGFPFYAGINMSGNLRLYGSFGNNDVNIVRPSTEEERKELLDMLEDFASWEKEDKKGGDDKTKNPQRKFKTGDKVRIKDGISSETHFSDSFVPEMDKFLGKVLTIKGYVADGIVNIIEDPIFFWFSEEWLEPDSESIKIGDWVIYFPDENKKLATVGILSDVVIHDGKLGFMIDNNMFVQQIIKWEGTKEQLENVRKGES